MSEKCKFGNRLRLIRDSRGMRIQEMSDLLGIPYATVQDYEVKEKTPPMKRSIEIAEKLGVPVGWMVGDGPVFSFETGEYDCAGAIDEASKEILCGIEELKRAIKPSREWVSVKDKTPIANVPVLVAYEAYSTREVHADGVAAIDRFGNWGWWDGDAASEDVLVKITHWMPLPEPPEEGTP